jgi:glutathione S-transferase
VITLCGFSASNYYNKVKLALLEKGIRFQEHLVYPFRDPSVLADSPMGKVPYILDGDTPVSESQAIIEYLEDVYPEPRLYPLDPKRAAKCRELIHVMELYLELPARRLYGEAFFGGKASDDARKEVPLQFARASRALERLALFDPFVAGAEFSYADCAACMHLPIVSRAAQLVLGENPLAGIDGLSGYLDTLAGRPHVQRVNSECRAGLDAFVAMRKRA